MKIAHLADLHLGYRQFDRWTNGRNTREVDIECAVAQAFAGVAAARPDLVLLAGDIFHSVRPPNGATLFLFRELQRLRAALPETHIVMIAGDHDSPRSSDVRSILPLFGALGVRVVEGTTPQRVPCGPAMVTAVPKWALGKIPEPIPGGINILLAHGEARKVGTLKPEIDAAVFTQPWDYIALGHWHVCQRMAANAWYAGSLEYVSSDPWDELRQQTAQGVTGKGWALVELMAPTQHAAGELRHTIMPVPTRRFLDLEPLDASGMGAPELGSALVARLQDVELDGAVVRLVVSNVPRLVQRDLNQKDLQALKARALNLQIRYDRPEAEAVTPVGRAMRRQRLDQIVDEFLGARALPSDVDREALRVLGQEYLTLATEEGRHE